MPCRIACCGDRVDHLLALDEDVAGVDRIGAEDGARRLRAAGADEARDAQNLAAPHFEGDVVEHHCMWVLRVAAAGQPLDAERHRARLRRLTLPKEVAHLAPDHLADDPVDRGVRNVAASDHLPVAKHGVAIADLASPPRGDG